MTSAHKLSPPARPRRDNRRDITSPATVRSAVTHKSNESSAIEWSPVRGKPKFGGSSNGTQSKGGGVGAGGEENNNNNSNNNNIDKHKKHHGKHKHKHTDKKKHKGHGQHMSRRDVRELKELFRLWGEANDRITFTGTKLLLDQLGQNPTDLELTAEIGRCKIDKTDKQSLDMNFEELKDLVQERFHFKHSQQTVIDALRVLDTSGSGRLSVGDLAGALVAVGNSDEVATKKLIMSLLKGGEIDEDGELLYGHFIERIMHGVTL